MSTRSYLIAIVLFATINGIFSPWLVGMFPFVFVLMPAFFLESLSVLLFVSSILFATLTLIAGGIPAALYERWSGVQESTEVSMWIWLAGVGLLTLPAAANLFLFGL
jgi:hypothetical protein